MRLGRRRLNGACCSPCSTAYPAIRSTPPAGVCHGTCDSGPRETWQPQSKLEEQLKAKGWQVRRIKIDGGCYEVYALNEKGERVEAYFHPQTLAAVPTKKE